MRPQLEARNGKVQDQDEESCSETLQNQAQRQNQAGQAQQAANENGQQSDIVAVVSTSDGEFNPFDAFNISEPDTYCNLWSFDLFNSCNDGSTCQCTYTEQLISKDLLSCSEAWDCPSSCPSCLQCMRNVCGATATVVTAVRTGAKALPAFLSILTVVLAVCYIVPRKKKDVEAMKESLIDTDTEMSELAGKTWMVPVSKVDGLPTEQGDECRPVWLAPVNKPDLSQENSASLKPDKQKREETAMLVVVPRPATDKQNGGSVFPDILKNDDGTDACTSDSAKDTGGKDLHRMDVEEFTPGLWLVPLSQESVASSISESDDEDDLSIGSALDDDEQISSSDSSRSSGSGSDDAVSEPSLEDEDSSSRSQRRIEDESAIGESAAVGGNPPVQPVLEPPKPEYRLRDDDSFSLSKASTISTKDEEEESEELTVGPGMGEI